MKYLRPWLILGMACGAMPNPGSADEPPQAQGKVAMDTAPDPEKAMLAEYKRTKERGTVEAYELFIERHPDHPLADDARRRLKQLRGG
jgi:hypothetical protein